MRSLAPAIGWTVGIVSACGSLWLAVEEWRQVGGDDRFAVATAGTAPMMLAFFVTIPRLLAADPDDRLLVIASRFNTVCLALTLAAWAFAVVYGGGGSTWFAVAAAVVLGVSSVESFSRIRASERRRIAGDSSPRYATCEERTRLMVGFVIGLVSLPLMGAVMGYFIGGARGAVIGATALVAYSVITIAAVLIRHRKRRQAT